MIHLHDRVDTDLKRKGTIVGFLTNNRGETAILVALDGNNPKYPSIFYDDELTLIEAISGEHHGRPTQPENVPASPETA